MKLFNVADILQLEITITRDKERTKVFQIWQTTLLECKEAFEGLIAAQKVSPFQEKYKTSICIREHWAGKYGKYTAVSFRGLGVSETYKLIMEYLGEEAPSKIPLMPYKSRYIPKEVRYNHRNMPVKQYDINGKLIATHLSIKDAADSIKFNRSTFRVNLIKNKQPIGGYIWKLKEKTKK